ncbi:hypothetical protein B0H10DRAFT_2021041, partial [Mycena sp. CBHHK59/15]
PLHAKRSRLQKGIVSFRAATRESPSPIKTGSLDLAQDSDGDEVAEWWGDVDRRRKRTPRDAGRLICLTPTRHDMIVSTGWASARTEQPYWRFRCLL